MIENSQWYKYQKNIPDGPFFYVRSCIRQTFSMGAENILIRILTEKLGLKVFEDQRHTCCSGIAYHSDLVPIETSMTIIARQFSLMTELGYEHLLVSCVTSFGLYNEVLDIWHHYPEKLEETRETLLKATGRTFELPKSIIHTSDIIYKHRNELAEQMKYRLINNRTAYEVVGAGTAFGDVVMEPDYRGKGIAGRLLDFTVDEMKSKHITPIYLITDHVGFYERYGWEFLCMVQGDGEPDMTRMYIHR